MPGTSFVHNRLTHSLEVASVGRSLGKMVGERISEAYRGIDNDVFEFYRYELANVIAAACLAHDIGNPAFGHSGEKAISAYFIDHGADQFNGQQLRQYFNEKEWSDLCNFEGNANAVRVLTHSFKGRFKGGFGLTYTTIASILKYPCESVARDKSFRHRKKFGFFQSEKDSIKEIADALGMIQESAEPLVYKRHPFVYLVEAADDICYSIVDMEDAQRLGILNAKEVYEAFMEVIDKVADDPKASEYYHSIEDVNEALAFLRARVINHLVNQAADIFMENQVAILEGSFNNTLLDLLQERTKALSTIQEISIERIYNHQTVMQVEIAGYNVMSELLQLFVPALLSNKPSHKDEKVLRLIPYQFTEFKDTESAYLKVMNALDLLSGMTDEYATELYRNLTGISIPRH